MLSQPELIQKLQSLQNADRPYVVSIEGNQLKLALNLVDAKWFGVFEKDGLKDTFEYIITLDEPTHTATIVTQRYRVEWSAGVPRLSAYIKADRGESYTKEYEVAFGVNDQLKPGKLYEYTLDSVKGLAALRGIIKDAGWSVKRGMSTKIGMIAAAVAVIGGIVALVVLLLGR